MGSLASESVVNQVRGLANTEDDQPSPSAPPQPPQCHPRGWL